MADQRVAEPPRRVHLHVYERSPAPRRHGRGPDRLSALEVLAIALVVGLSVAALLVWVLA